jgi:NitT/TauT family transport system substrate-binding protein
MSVKRSATLSFVFTAFVTLSVVGVNSCAQRHEPMEHVSLRLQWTHQAQFAGFYVAKEHGFYKARGLDVTIGAGGIGFNVPALVATEKEDFGIWMGDQVLLAFDQQKLPIKAIGTVFKRSLACFMVKADSGIESPKDFRGKRIGVYPGFDTETIYHELLRRYGVPQDQVTNYPAAYTLVPFIAGQVDVWPSYVINEPIVAQEQKVPVRLLDPATFGINYYSDTIIVNERTLRERESTVKRFLEASEEGWRYALSHPEEAVDIVTKYDPSLDKHHQAEMLRAEAEYLNTTDPLFEMKPATWQSMATILSQQQAISDPQSYTRLCDFTVAGKAHQSHAK